MREEESKDCEKNKREEKKEKKKNREGKKGKGKETNIIMKIL